MKVIMDPLHGEIKVPEDFLQVINKPEFQRLRRIKQLGLTQLVYPSATHTRFLHSIGVFHLSRSFNDETLSLYALLHDVGHAPLSHVVERALQENGIKFDHDDEMWKLLPSLLQDTVFTPADVRKAERLLVSGDLGIDRVDYLLRDSYFTGVRVGYISWERLVRLMRVEDGRIVVEEKGRDVVEHFFIARFLLGSSVYFHKTNMIIEGMVSRAVGYLLEEISWKEIVRMDDEGFACAMRQSESRAGEIWNMITRRRLYKPVFVGKSRDRALEKYEKFDDALFIERPTWHREVTAVVGETPVRDLPLVRALVDADREGKRYIVAVHPDELAGAGFGPATSRL